MAKQNYIQLLDIPIPETYKIEQQVLADLVTAPEAMGDVYPLIHRDMFTNDERRGIWDVIADHYNRGRSFDIVTLTQVVGQPFLEEVLPWTVSPATMISALDHAGVLRNEAAKRRAYIAAVSFIQTSVAPESTEADILASVETFSARVDGPAPVQVETTIGQAIEAVRQDILTTQQAEKEGRRLRTPTGFPRLDEILNGGFKAGQLVVLAARPSVGKTSVMLHLAKEAARTGFPVYISTLEMTDTELGEKFLFSTGEVRPGAVTHGNVDWARFNAAAADLSGLPVLINQFSRTLDQIMARITQAVKAGRCRIAFIDYLGLIQDTGNLGGNAKLYQIIAKITGSLKALAKRCSIPVVLLCQLNRDTARLGKSPELFDLRDSGSIEQDADTVLMLENKWRNGRTEIIAWLRKNRSGRRSGTNGKDLGYVLIPNDTYSDFEEAGIENEIDLPEPVTTPEEEKNDPELFEL